MTPDQIVLVQDSFELLLPAADATADAFYTRLFVAAPHLRGLFPDDLSAQRRKFLASLQALVEALWRPSDLAASLHELGARHVGYGVLPEHYALVGRALLSAMSEQLGAAWAPEVEAAWGAAYCLVAEAMSGAPVSALEQIG